MSDEDEVQDQPEPETPEIEVDEDDEADDGQPPKGSRAWAKMRSERAQARREAEQLRAELAQTKRTTDELLDRWDRFMAERQQSSAVEDGKALTDRFMSAPADEFTKAQLEAIKTRKELEAKIAQLEQGQQLTQQQLAMRQQQEAQAKLHGAVRQALGADADDETVGLFMSAARDDLLRKVQAGEIDPRTFTDADLVKHTSRLVERVRGPKKKAPHVPAQGSGRAAPTAPKVDRSKMTPEESRADRIKQMREALGALS